ncbi:hypothetical protein D9M72_305950 [compost metagenome]
MRSTTSAREKRRTAGASTGGIRCGPATSTPSTTTRRSPMAPESMQPERKSPTRFLSSTTSRPPTEGLCTKRGRRQAPRSSPTFCARTTTVPPRPIEQSASSGRSMSAMSPCHPDTGGPTAGAPTNAPRRWSARTSRTGTRGTATAHSLSAPRWAWRCRATTTSSGSGTFNTTKAWRK